MAKLVVVAVRDRASDTFARPFFVPALGVALRGFSDEINRADADNNLYKHPDDYDLYEIGSFDEDTAELIPIKPKMVAIGKSVAIRGGSDA